MSCELVRILGGSCDNEWIVEETGDDTTHHDDDIASCMETDEDENGKENNNIHISPLNKKQTNNKQTNKKTNTDRQTDKETNPNCLLETGISNQHPKVLLLIIWRYTNERRVLISHQNLILTSEDD